MKNNSINSNYILFGVIGVLLVVIGFAVVLGNSKNDAPKTALTNNSSSLSSENSEKNQNVSESINSSSNSSSSSSNNSSTKTSENESKKGEYTVYSSEKLASSDKQNLVIFFNASWCPTCKIANNNINSDLESIPSDLAIFNADYDKETELKKKYGVTYQHTFVKVDKNGVLIKKASGLNKVEEIVEFVK